MARLLHLPVKVVAEHQLKRTGGGRLELAERIIIRKAEVDAIFQVKTGPEVEGIVAALLRALGIERRKSGTEGKPKPEFFLKKQGSVKVEARRGANLPHEVSLAEKIVEKPHAFEQK